MIKITQGNELFKGRFNVEIDEENQCYHVLKDGNICWSESFVDLLFNYVTRTWGEL